MSDGFLLSPYFGFEKCPGFVGRPRVDVDGNGTLHLHGLRMATAGIDIRFLGFPKHTVFCIHGLSEDCPSAGKPPSLVVDNLSRSADEMKGVE